MDAPRNFAGRTRRDVSAAWSRFRSNYAAGFRVGRFQSTRPGRSQFKSLYLRYADARGTHPRSVDPRNIDRRGLDPRAAGIGSAWFRSAKLRLRYRAAGASAQTPLAPPADYARGELSAAGNAAAGAGAFSMPLNRPGSSLTKAAWSKACN